MSQTTSTPERQEGISEEADSPTERGTEGEEGGAAETPSEPSLPLDQIFDVLRNERRRVVLRFLADADEPVSMSDLSEAVAAHENDKPVAHLSSDERKRVYVGLYQCHLPKMDSMDIVAFNKPRGMVELAENYELVEPYLEEDDGEEAVDGRRWARRYLALSGVGLLALTLAVAVGGELLVQAAFGLVVVGVATCSAAYWHAVYEAGDDED